MSLIVVRLQMGDYASANNTVNNLHRAVWMGLVEMIDTPEVTVRTFIHNMGLLAGKGSVQTMIALALRLRDQATRRYPFARFGFVVNDGPLELSSRDEQLRGPCLDKAMLGMEHVTGNQIVIHARQTALIKDQFTTVEAPENHLFVLHPIPQGDTPPASESIDQHAAHHVGFIGRLAERKRLETLLNRIHTGKPGAPILITGEEGLGKTHVVRFIRAMAQLIGLPVLESYSHNRLLDRPFRPLLNLVAQACGQGSDNLQETARLDHLHRDLRLMGLDEHDIQALLEQLFSGTQFVQNNTLSQLADDQPLSYTRLCGALDQFPPEDRLRVMVGSLSHLLTNVTAPGGAVVIIEDVHQSDASSVRALPTLCELCHQRPLLLICTALSENINGLDHFEVMPLAHLEEEQRRPFWEKLRDHKRSAKSQVNTALIPDNALTSSMGLPLYAALWLEQSQTTDPETSIEALIAARLQTLPERIQRLMTIASTLGEYFEQKELVGLFPQSNSL
ncbi:MAG: AAA family ATPase, partial [Myxococcota bacterium]